MNKYKNKKVEYENIKFDSEMECEYYKQLRKFFKKEDIIIQPKFLLQESFKYKGKTIKAITYTGDFQVFDTVYDVKGMLTQQGEMRIKMFKYHYRDLALLVITKAPKWTGRDWIEVEELKKMRKNKKEGK